MGSGFGLILGGRYYLRLDPDTVAEERPVSGIRRFSIVHRHQLGVVAQTGALFSLIYFGVACLGKDWPGRWFLWPIGLGATVLQSIARKIADPNGSEALGWSKVPRWMRAIIEPTKRIGDSAMLGLVLLICWNQFSGHSVAHSGVYHFASRIVAIGYITLLFVLEALFFAYGEVLPER